LEEDEEPGKLK
jgi:hypothetical protein